MVLIRTTSIVGLALLAAVALAGCAPSGSATQSSTGGAASSPGTAAPVPAAPSTSAAPAPASSGSGAASSVAKACALITAAQFGAAIGRTVVAADRDLGQFDSCAYTSGAKAAGALLVRRLSRPDFEKSVAASPGKKTPVSGTGDAAYSAVVNGTTVIAAWHAGVELSLTMSASNPLAKEEALATAAFSTLPG